MRVLVCAATGTEARACAQGIRDSGQMSSYEILRTGVGFENARLSLTQRLRNGPRKPDMIVASGFAGALSANVPLHSWIVAKSLLRAHKDDDVRLHPIEVHGPSPRVAGTVACNLISAAELTLPESAHARLFAAVDEPRAVDMESAILGELAHEAGIPFFVLRMITDTPDQPLPHFLARFTSAMTADEPLIKRAKHGVIGLREALVDPKGVLRLVKHGPRWGSMLRAGWAKFAPSLTCEFGLS